MDLRPRFDVSRPTLTLLAGDVALIALFVLVGEFRHYPAAEALARWPVTTVPFLVGWLLAGSAVGTFARDALADGRTAVKRTAIAWFAADVVAQLLRALPWVPGNADVAFFLVALLTGGALLVAWRYLAARAV